MALRILQRQGPGPALGAGGNMFCGCGGLGLLLYRLIDRYTSPRTVAGAQQMRWASSGPLSGLLDAASGLVTRCARWSCRGTHAMALDSADSVLQHPPSPLPPPLLPAACRLLRAHTYLPPTPRPPHLLQPAAAVRHARASERAGEGGGGAAEPVGRVPQPVARRPGGRQRRDDGPARHPRHAPAHARLGDGAPDPGGAAAHHGAPRAGGPAARCGPRAGCCLGGGAAHGSIARSAWQQGHAPLKVLPPHLRGHHARLTRPCRQDEVVAPCYSMPPHTFGGAYAAFMGARGFAADDRPPCRCAPRAGGRGCLACLRVAWLLMPRACGGLRQQWRLAGGAWLQRQQVLARPASRKRPSMRSMPSTPLPCRSFIDDPELAYVITRARQVQPAARAAAAWLRCHHGPPLPASRLPGVGWPPCLAAAAECCC